MKKHKIVSALLPFVLLLSACGAEPSPSPAESVPPSSSSAVSSESALSAALPLPGSSSAASSAPEPSSASGSSSAVSSAPPSSGGKTDRPPVSSRAVPIPAAPRQSLTPIPSAAAAAVMPPVAVRLPQAPGTHVFARQGCTLDYSNTPEGYVMAKYSGSAKLKLLVYFNGSSSYYQYNLAGDDVYHTLPLQSGNGSYRIRFMENVSGSSYAELCSTTVSATISGWGHLLYPNQYVSYTASTAAVKKAAELTKSATSNAQKVAVIYHFVSTTIKYDYAKADSVTTGYLPNVDSTLTTKKGICFDYAALMTAMCRSQGIPTRLIIGDTTAGYHAWNEIYLEGWKRYDATFAAAGQTAGTYTPQRYY